MKKILTTLLLLVALLPVFAQRGEKIESLKIAFISEKLNLDAETAKRFWPIYNQYENDMRTVVQQHRQLKKEDNKSVDDILDQEQKALDIKKKYATQFLKVISNEQLSQLYRAEKEFRQMIMRRAGGK